MPAPPPLFDPPAIWSAIVATCEVNAVPTGLAAAGGAGTKVAFQLKVGCGVLEVVLATATGWPLEGAAELATGIDIWAAGLADGVLV